MAPTSVYPEAELASSGPGQAISEVAPFLVDLPVGEGNPVVRLSQIAHATESHSAAASLVDARTIVTLSGSRRRRCTRWAPGWRPSSRPASSTC